MSKKPSYPTFIFARRRDIEIEAGLALAGNLVVDIPKGRRMERREQQFVQEIIDRLYAGVRSGRMGNDAWCAAGRAALSQRTPLMCTTTL